MDANKDGDQFNRKKDDDHQDHRINRNVDQDSLKNNEETENKNLNEDVTGESSSATSQSLTGSQVPPNVGSVVQRGRFTLYDFADTMPGSQISRISAPSTIDRYFNSFLDANVGSMPVVPPVADPMPVVPPVADPPRNSRHQDDTNVYQVGRFRVTDYRQREETMELDHDAQSDNARDQQDDMELDHDQPSGSSSTDAKKAKK